MSGIDLHSSLKQATRPLDRRIRMLAGRGMVSATDDSNGVQVFQLSGLPGEVLPFATRVQQFGLSSRPPKGSTAVVLCMGGSRSYPVVIAVDAPGVRKINFAEGESAQQNAFGDYVWIKADGTIHIKASSKVFVESPEAEFTGNVTIDGNLTVNGNAVVDGTTHLVGDVLADADVSIGGGLDVAGATALTGDATAAGAMAVQGALSSATSVSDGTRTMAEIVGAFNPHTHDGLSGSHTNPPVPQST